MNARLRLIGLVLCLFGIGLYARPGLVEAAQAAMSVNVPAGKHKAVRLRNLPKGAIVGVAVQTSGAIAISLLSEQEYRRFPRVQDPVFLGTVERKLSFTVTIPTAGNFYFVLDNRRAAEACKVKFVISAQRGRTPKESEPDAAPKEGERGT